MLGAEVRSSIEQHGEAAHSVAEAVVELREGVEAAKAVAEVQLAAAGSIRTELLTVASGTQDGVGLAGDMRELVDSLAARAQELARSAAQFRLREGNGARDRRRGVAPPIEEGGHRLPRAGPRDRAGRRARRP